MIDLERAWVLGILITLMVVAGSQVDADIGGINSTTVQKWPDGSVWLRQAELDSVWVGATCLIIISGSDTLCADVTATSCSLIPAEVTAPVILGELPWLIMADKMAQARNRHVGPIWLEASPDSHAVKSADLHAPWDGTSEVWHSIMWTSLPPDERR